MAIGKNRGEIGDKKPERGACQLRGVGLALPGLAGGGMAWHGVIIVSTSMTISA